MWSRRFLRAGWLIAPIFTFPAKAWDFAVEWFDWGVAALITVILLMLWGVIALVAALDDRTTRHHTVATPTQVKEAVADTCVGGQLKKYLEENPTSAIRWIDIDYAKRQCTTFTARQQQEAVLK